MDRFESMRVLVAVVDAGSLSAAGRRLSMPLATVSRRISELEAELKTRLDPRDLGTHSCVSFDFAAPRLRSGGRTRRTQG